MRKLIVIESPVKDETARDLVRVVSKEKKEISENLIKNGSFEFGYDYWNIEKSSKAYYELASDKKTDGKYSFKGYIGNYNWIRLIQNVNVEANKVYELSFDYLNSTTYQELDVDIDYLQDNTLIKSERIYSQERFGWIYDKFNRFSISFLTPSGCNNINLKVYSYGTYIGTVDSIWFYIDNVKLVKIPQPFIPKYANWIYRTLNPLSSTTITFINEKLKEKFGIFVYSQFAPCFIKILAKGADYITWAPSYFVEFETKEMQIIDSSKIYFLAKEFDNYPWIEKYEITLENRYNTTIYTGIYVYFK